MDEDAECESCGEIYDLESYDSYDLLLGQEPVILCNDCYLDEVAGS